MSESSCPFKPGDIVQYSLGTIYLIVRLSDEPGDWAAVVIKHGHDSENGTAFPYPASRFTEHQHNFTKLGSIDEL